YSAGRRFYETADGWLCLAIANDAQWTALIDSAKAAGAKDVAKFADPAARKDCDKSADDVLGRTLEAAFKLKPASAWFATLDQAGVPCEIIDPDFGPKLHDDKEMKKRRWVASFPHQFVGRIDQIGLCADFSETPGRLSRAPLVVGECTREIMAE